jgi:hypothetical protein
MSGEAADAEPTSRAEASATAAAVNLVLIFPPFGFERNTAVAVERFFATGGA